MPPRYVAQYAPPVARLGEEFFYDVLDGQDNYVARVRCKTRTEAETIAVQLNLQHEHHKRLEALAAPPAKWHYRGDSLLGDEGNLILALADAGSQGWECMAIRTVGHNTWLYYKRPVRE